MSQLDKSRPYGAVVGIATYAYEQDHKRFDAEGNEVDPKEEPVSVPDTPDTVRTVDLAKKENAALRPAAQKKAADDA